MYIKRDFKSLKRSVQAETRVSRFLFLIVAKSRMECKIYDRAAGEKEAF